MDWLRLLGWLVVIVLIGVIVIFILFEIVGRAFDFAEANPLTVAVFALIILIILLVAPRPGAGPPGAEHSRHFGSCGPAAAACPPR